MGASKEIQAVLCTRMGMKIVFLRCRTASRKVSAAVAIILLFDQ